MSRAVTCICRTCGKAEVTSGGNQHFKCKQCTPQKAAEEKPRSKAAAMVARAVKKGLLAPAKTKKCTDCGCNAIEYDHRDYLKPLEVEPVCRRCNIIRGPALNGRVTVNRFAKAKA